MMTHPKLVPIDWTPELLVEATRGLSGVYGCGQAVRSKLTATHPTLTRALEVAQTAGHVLVPVNHTAG